jgi:hypothetical protein
MKSSRLLTQSCALLLIVVVSSLSVKPYKFPDCSGRIAVSCCRVPARTLALSMSPIFISESANRVYELGDWSVNVAKSLAEIVVNGPTTNPTEADDSETGLPVASALDNFRQEMSLLDNVATRTPQLTSVELAVLLTTISLSALSPFFLNIDVIEVLVPSLAALSASVGISAEYIGKIAVSNGKEFAALAIIAAAEAEALLAEAERSKAVLPFCVGIATTASAFALVAPALVKEVTDKYKLQVLSEVYFICPIVALLAAALAKSVTIASQKLAARATSWDKSKYPTTSSLMRTFSNKEEQFEDSNKATYESWRRIAMSIVPSLVMAALFPGALATKAIVCTACGAAQSAYYMTVAEYSIAVATDAVALKARSAAVSDFYANQASRAGAILPFTSALAGFCAAASAAAVELLPFVNTAEQAIVALLFPSGAALFAAAAAVSKARCQVRHDFKEIKFS